MPPECVDCVTQSNRFSVSEHFLFRLDSYSAKPPLGLHDRTIGSGREVNLWPWYEAIDSRKDIWSDSLSNYKQMHFPSHPQVALGQTAQRGPHHSDG